MSANNVTLNSISLNDDSDSQNTPQSASPKQTIATAPGKVILFGEHAVVYGRPAIAVPVWGVQAKATITDTPTGSGCTISAPDINLHFRLARMRDNQPLALVIRIVLQKLGILNEPDWRILLHSELPIAGGLGSGAALSAALVRAIFAHVGQPVAADEVSEIVFESERFYHGTPSGIDNTVIAYGVPIWFVKGEPPQTFQPGCPLHLLIADSGVRSPTKETVGDVRKAWQQDPTRYERYFDAIGEIANKARQAIKVGAEQTVGELFNQNHLLLREIGVSSPLLDRLTFAALTVGAIGAKLSGGGRGGNVIALIAAQNSAAVTHALLEAGAKRVLATTILPE